MDLAIYNILLLLKEDDFIGELSLSNYFYILHWFDIIRFDGGKYFKNWWCLNKL